MVRTTTLGGSAKDVSVAKVGVRDSTFHLIERVNLIFEYRLGS